MEHFHILLPEFLEIPNFFSKKMPLHFPLKDCLRVRKPSSQMQTIHVCVALVQTRDIALLLVQIQGNVGQYRG